MNYDFCKIISNFKLKGELVSCERYGEGHINETYLAVLENKGVQTKYIVQKINKNLFKDVDKLMNNIRLVTEHARKKIAERGGNPDREKALKYVKAFDYDKHAEKLREFIGKGADAMIANEKTERKYDAAKHAARLEAILGKWKDIISIIEEEIPPKSRINGILGKIGAPETIEELGIEGDIYRVFGFTKDIRDKYVLSRLLWDLGETENVFRS